MAYAGFGISSSSNYGSSGSWFDAREPGARRKKLAGYLKAANELRQTYFSQDGTTTRHVDDDGGVEGPGAFPDAAVVRSGNEEMILFPSYAKEHKVRKLAPPPPSSEIESDEQDYWRKEWERNQDDNAIVDVDVRGWIYTPQRGQTNRRQRLMIGIARQLSGVPAPPSDGLAGSSKPSPASSRAQSPSIQDEDLISFEAENIIRKGEREERYARRGAFSEDPSTNNDSASLYGGEGQGASGEGTGSDLSTHRLSQISAASSAEETSATPPKRQDTGLSNSKMLPHELHAANRHLLNRLKPFMATPLANTAISAFFYNERASRQHTFYTNAAGHFSYRAALDFFPTHVRVLAGEKLSVTEDVIVTSPLGVSLISDIDDTVKHSAITAGAKEIFRTAFVRELGELAVEGVREWYTTLNDMGVQIHYVSNSPWQMYPILTAYFKMARLPRGSFHLKQYSGMLQGIFEPVAERKRANLDKILADFPSRKFVLVGDSGEADLEVYTDVALQYPGRILGIFIRDVTTTKQSGYFDPSNDSNSGVANGRGHARQRTADGTLTKSKRLSRPLDTQNDDADLQAAIAASLSDMEQETLQARRNINPDLPASRFHNLPGARPAPLERAAEKQVTAGPRPGGSNDEPLIDLRETPGQDNNLSVPPPRKASSGRYQSDLSQLDKRPSPSRPPKPRQLRSPSPNSLQNSSSDDMKPANKAPPPRPRKPSTAIQPSQAHGTQDRRPINTSSSVPSIRPEHRPSPLRQVTEQSPMDSITARPLLPPRPKTRELFSGNKPLVTTSTMTSSPLRVHALMTPPFAQGSSGKQSEAARAKSTMSTASSENLRSVNSTRPAVAPAPPPPRRREAPVPPPGTIKARISSNRLSGASNESNDGGTDSLPGTPGEAGVSRKEFLWMQRWARAKKILESQGVTLRSWRVGSDVADVCVRLVEMALRDIEKESRQSKAENGTP